MSGEKFDAYVTEVTPQFLADLRHLVSIAMWIRSEQLAQRDVQRLIKTVDPSQMTHVGMPMTFIDTRDLSLADAVKDTQACAEMWNRLNEMLEIMDQKSLKATWRK